MASQAAIDIDRAHKVYRDAIGTSFEAAAKANLKRVVSRVVEQSTREAERAVSPPWWQRVTAWVRGG